MVCTGLRTAILAEICVRAGRAQKVTVIMHVRSFLSREQRYCRRDTANSLFSRRADTLHSLRHVHFGLPCPRTDTVPVTVYAARVSRIAGHQFRF
jgi:hypothetical protein